MFLTIIIPSYNHGHFITECLDSIFSQKFKEGVRVIVIDNFSSDQTINILKKYKKKFKLIDIYQKKMSQAEAINFGILKSKSLFVAWQNCDDFYIQNSFDIFYQTYLNSKDADIIYGNMDIISLNGRFIRNLHFDYLSLYNLISEGMIISNQSCIFRRKLFNKFSIIKTHNSFDYDLFLKLSFYKKKFVRVKSDASLGVFRIYKDQKSFLYSSKDNMVREKIRTKYKYKYAIYNKQIAKFLRFVFILGKKGIKYLINYARQESF